MPESMYIPVLKPVKTPAGLWPIEIVQFWRGEESPGRPRPLRWVIVVRTSADRGHWHEVVSDGEMHSARYRYNVPLAGLERREDWRGSHVIGYIAPHRMNDLYKRMARVPMEWNERYGCYAHQWVHDALWGFWHIDFYVDGHLTFATLETHMCCMLEAWELGDL